MQNYELTAIYTETGFVPDKTPTDEKNVRLDEKLYNNFFEKPYETLYGFCFSPVSQSAAESVIFLSNIAKRFIETTLNDSNLEISRKAKTPDDRILLELLHEVPFAIGIEFVNITWFRGIWAKLSELFDADIALCPGSEAIADYIKAKSSELNPAGRVFFHLVEHKGDDYPFAFLATYSTGDRDRVNHVPLKNALVEHKDNQEKMLVLLSTVSKAAEKSDFISDLVETGELFSPLKFGVKEAYIFLSEAGIYEECGISCRIPDWWKKKAKLSVSVGSKEPAAVGLQAIMAFSPSFFLGDVELTREEAEKLLSDSNGLAFIKGKWVNADKDRLQAALAAFDKINKTGDMSFAEAMRLQLGISDILPEDQSDEVEITNGAWLNGVIDKLRSPAKIDDIAPPKDFAASLRNYQQKGLNWLSFVTDLGFGALLADDMGLGKTVQVLALLSCLRDKKIKTLLVIPTSLLQNWKIESAKFAPDLRIKIIHSVDLGVSGIKNFDVFGINENEADLFITTYGMLSRLEDLQKIDWDLLVLDEAQAVKNPASGQSKAVKQLNAKKKIAMTGTPIENRLSDLWSIFDFLNKGMLGTKKEFDAFSKRLKDNAGGYARLRETISPFILRRLKTDKSVISDLPDKIENKSYTTLTKKQIVLYDGLVKEIESALDVASGISRKGLILASIMKFKQICNHPAQYLGQSAFDSKLSGKFDKLSEICETIREKRERVLVFTQFREMTKPLADYLEEIFGEPGLIIHGGTPAKKRGELVEKFNGAEYIPFMVLSLKAGGVGLNLTAANHVIHFDRWWNPAVENQATDRAFRIGQSKNVMVYKFVTSGTIEEKIDSILEEKKKLSNDVIAENGENWITEMSNSELMNMFKLEI
ncbi:MAG: DEAD/DEAH box helicase [Oscillospiraceae bacterium]|nr:DEAD/DEAH box helicase [Oscillospiraceae bacterium]